MSELKFRCVIDEVLCDITPFKPYAIKCNDDVGLLLISFKESETDQIRKLFTENVREEYTAALDNIHLDGSDGYFYVMSRESIDKKEKSSHSLIKMYRYYWNLNYKKKERQGKLWIQKNLEKYDNGLKRFSKGKFSAYKYIDKENNMCFPFRLHESKKENQPLFIIFHGAGALGNDNIKQHFENKRLYKKMLQFNCNILSPQAPFGSNRGKQAIPNYIRTVKKLVDELPTNFDKKRIYIVGTSFGGFCVWHISYLFPGYFAAGVPVMGGLLYDDSYDMQRLTKTPLWVAHSSDDTNVPIDNDDHYVAELQKLGADVKYTRWDKYGHSMSNKFYKTENWAEWCLSKELKFEEAGLSYHSTHEDGNAMTYVYEINPIAKHYDILINEGNDPVHDPEPLKAYMDKWDGQAFIDKMQLSKDKTVLEIGVGTGRLAVRTAPLCKEFYGIDISPETIKGAKKNLEQCQNVNLICDDFMKYNFKHNFDVIYSSLTFMHIKDKQGAINKIQKLLKYGGLFVLSTDKNQDEFIDIGSNKIEIYPDTLEEIIQCINNSGLELLEHYETEFANVFVCKKQIDSNSGAMNKMNIRTP